MRDCRTGKKLGPESNLRAALPDELIHLVGNSEREAEIFNPAQEPLVFTVGTEQVTDWTGSFRGLLPEERL